MSASYWAGDSIAQSIEAAGARARANSTLARQQSYHAGDIAIKNAALIALRELTPDHPLLNGAVQDRMFAIAQGEFYRRGWENACQLELDPASVCQELNLEFESARAKAIADAEAEPVTSKRRGVFLMRYTEWRWRKFASEDENEVHQAKQNEIDRLKNCTLGDQLNIK